MIGDRNHRRNHENPSRGWDQLVVYHQGDPFFSSLVEAINSAKRSVDMEVYIFVLDIVGERVLAALKAARARGVRVRLAVDGIGSSTTGAALRERAAASQILFKIYHELPWERWWRGARAGVGRKRVRDLLRRLNTRNHRKMCIIDGTRAFVGSMNVAECHLASLVGDAAWRDTGVMIEGPDVRVLVDTFEEVWAGTWRRLRRRLKRHHVHTSELIRLNVRRKQRRQNFVDLLVRVVGARQRVWITNAYFVPDGSIIRALSVAAQSGVDVRILVPRFSDVVFMPWVAAAFHFGLLKAGVRVFEYNRSILHAKTMLIDEWALVGSSNLNHRSLLHDLEADIVLDSESARLNLESQFITDCKNAAEITLDNWRARPFLERILGRILLGVRYLL